MKEDIVKACDLPSATQSTPPATMSLRSEGRKYTDRSGQPHSDLDLRGEEG